MGCRTATLSCAEVRGSFAVSNDSIIFLVQLLVHSVEFTNFPHSPNKDTICAALLQSQREGRLLSSVVLPLQLT